MKSKDFHPNVPLIKNTVHSRSSGPLPGSNPHLATTPNHQFDLIKSLNWAYNLLSGLVWVSTVCSLPQHRTLLQGVCGKTQPRWGRGWLQGYPAREDCCAWEMEPHFCGLRVRQDHYTVQSAVWVTFSICSVSSGLVLEFHLSTLFLHILYRYDSSSLYHPAWNVQLDKLER